MRGTRPPEGYELFIVPKYTLKHGERRIDLPNKVGELLSILMGTRGALLSVRDISDSMYDHLDDNCSQWQWESIRQFMYHLKRELIAEGIKINIQARHGQVGYRFLGFELCEPQPELRRWRRRYKNMKTRKKKVLSAEKVMRDRKPKKQFKPEANPETRKLKKTTHNFPRYRNSGRPHYPPPKVLPPEYVAAQQAPWTFPDGREE
jgi:hypothetical protein